MEYLTQCLACQSTNFDSHIKTKAMMHAHNGELFNFDRCNDCGLVFLNPRVPAAELGAYYTAAYLPYRVEEAWGKYAHFVKNDQAQIDQKRVKRVKQFHPLTNKSRLLDVGCGKPTFLAALRKNTTADLMGIDFSDEGWINDPAAYQGIRLKKGEIAILKEEDPFDVITMWHYLEHDYHPIEHLKSLRSVARKGTQLIIEVPNYNSHTQRKFGADWSGYHTPRHTALYSPGNMQQLLENSGWKVQQILPYGTLAPYTLHWMSKMEQKQIDWSQSMEPRFWGYVRGMIMHAPLYAMQRFYAMGFLTAIAILDE